MQRWKSTQGVIISTIMLFSGTNCLFAQNKCDVIKPNTSQGIIASITRVVLQRDITIQFVVSNNTKTRVYIKDARIEDSQTAFLSSGAHIGSPSTAGIETTNEVAHCISSPACYGDLNSFSYIEPGYTLPFSFKYSSNVPFQNNDTISFSVALVARFAKPDGPDDQANPPKPIRFSFSSIPLGC